MLVLTTVGAFCFLIYDRPKGHVGTMLDVALALKLPNDVPYNSLITACAKVGKTEEVLDVFKSMQAAGVEADDISYNSLITACENGGAISVQCWILLLS